MLPTIASATPPSSTMSEELIERLYTTPLKRKEVMLEKLFNKYNTQTEYAKKSQAEWEELVARMYDTAVTTNQQRKEKLEKKYMGPMSPAAKPKLSNSSLDGVYSRLYTPHHFDEMRESLFVKYYGPEISKGTMKSSKSMAKGTTLGSSAGTGQNTSSSSNAAVAAFFGSNSGSGKPSKPTNTAAMAKQHSPAPPSTMLGSGSLAASSSHQAAAAPRPLTPADEKGVKHKTHQPAPPSAATSSTNKSTTKPATSRITSASSPKLTSTNTSTSSSAASTPSAVKKKAPAGTTATPSKSSTKSPAAAKKTPKPAAKTTPSRKVTTPKMKDRAGSPPVSAPPPAPDTTSLLLLLDNVEKLLQPLQQHPETKTNVQIDKQDLNKIVACYDYIMHRYTSQTRYKTRYGYSNSADGPIIKSVATAGKEVPSYFANVGGQSMYQRKLLSIAGLRNLVLFGRDIFRELQDKQFLGDPACYSRSTGLSKMKTYTGNTVDLDTPILRPSDSSTLATINMMAKHKGEPTFNSAEEFIESEKCREMVMAASQPLLQGFAEQFDLKTDELKKTRRVQIPASKEEIPVATHNTDRGKWPIWLYCNAGVISYHVNVPTLSDVVGALLQAPFHCAKAYLLSCKDNSEEDAFFEDAVADSCFNGKWKSIEMFLADRVKQGAINKVLDDLQAAHQHIFTMKFFDEDDDTHQNEINEMVKLLHGATGRDKNGQIRVITREDVAAWVEDPSAPV
eukprot:TRINITY_DN67989_c2_g2_i1.p1 TRINITY_DN67989_c2_g2~~TRINITY_DN67989_c2_g2_i1.p1  ORF type:complete len:734 (+),score=123.62 TRINITY_DN67989_c2_g2_i1:47-2248(+)